MATMKTLTGIDVLDIQKWLNKHLPPKAYSEIPKDSGIMGGKTDIDPRAVRDRFDEVFGPCGIGWAIVPIPGVGGMEVSPGGEKEKRFVCSLFSHQLRYTVVLDSGEIRDVYGPVCSDANDNNDRTYAMRGALTSLIKQFYAVMGGMNHIYSGEYTHVEAARDLGKSQSKGKSEGFSHDDLLKLDPKFVDRPTAATFYNYWVDRGLTESEQYAALNVKKLSEWKGTYGEANQACAMALRVKTEKEEIEQIPF